MAQIASHDPDLMIFKSGGGCLSLFGLPFLAAGIFIMTSPLWANTSNKGGESWFLVMPFGGIFAAVGLGLIFGRAGIIIDKRLGQITKWWGLLLPFKNTIYPLSDIQRVSISKEIRRSKNSSHTVYPVRLKGEAAEINIEESREYTKSRRCAENLAKFITLPLADASNGEEVIRDSDRLDESIREKVQRTGAARKIPPAPITMKTSYSIEGQEMQLNIPATGWHPICFIPLLLAIGIGAFIYFIGLNELFHDAKAPLLFKILAGLFIAIPMVGILMPVLKHATQHYTVLVSPEKLELISRWALGRTTRVMPTNEIEELQLSRSPIPEDAKQTPVPSFLIQLIGSGSIIARSDKMAFTFGKGLARQELEWLLAVIENTISV